MTAKTKRNLFDVVYISIIIFCFLLMVLAAHFTSSGKTNDNYSIIEPLSTTQETDSLRICTFDISDYNDGTKSLAFYTNHIFVTVYADNEIIYENKYSGGIWGHTNGSCWNFVTIPTDVTDLRIEFDAQYKASYDDRLAFIIGDVLDIYKSIYLESVPSMLISIFIIAAGIILIVYFIKIVVSKERTKGVLYLGIFALLFGFWSLNETNGAVLSIRCRTAVSFSQYLFLLLLSICCVFFIKEFLHVKDKFMWGALATANISLLVIDLIMQFMGIRDMKENITFTHILLITGMIYIIIIVIARFIKNRHDRTIRSYLIAITILIVSTSLDLKNYYTNHLITDTDDVGRLGFLLFICILGYDTVKSSMELIEKGKKAQLYEEMAITDSLTGVLNRNAFIRDQKSLTELDDVMVIIFDLNNLKIFNDTMGHSEGDLYIHASANIINSVFGPYGSVYRIGGDEFCAIIKQSGKISIDKLINEFLEAEDEYNEISEFGIDMHIAYGYAVFNPALDKDLEFTRNRADIMMYTNKKIIKNKTNQNYTR